MGDMTQTVEFAIYSATTTYPNLRTTQTLKKHRCQSYNKYNHNCGNYPTTYSGLDCYNSPYKVIDIIIDMNPESSNTTWSIKSTI